MYNIQSYSDLKSGLLKGSQNYSDTVSPGFDNRENYHSETGIKRAGTLQRYANQLDENTPEGQLGLLCLALAVFTSSSNTLTMNIANLWISGQYCYNASVKRSPPRGNENDLKSDVFHKELIQHAKLDDYNYGEESGYLLGGLHCGQFNNKKGAAWMLNEIYKDRVSKNNGDNAVIMFKFFKQELSDITSMDLKDIPKFPESMKNTDSLELVNFKRTSQSI